MPEPGFAQLVLEQRARDREALGRALTAERGPSPGSKQASETDQDAMWAQVHPDYADPPEVGAAFSRRLDFYRQRGLKDEQAVPLAATETAQMFPQSKFMQLMVPQAQGGSGLTALAASYEKYNYRRFLVEGAGDGGIEAQIAYANRRQERAGLGSQSIPEPAV